MKKLQPRTIEFALTIPEPEEVRGFKGNNKKAKKFMGTIEGEDIARSSRWWGLYKSATEKKAVGYDMVKRRVDSGWSELEATMAIKDETRPQLWERLGTSPVNSAGKTKFDQMFNKFIRGEYNDNNLPRM